MAVPEDGKRLIRCGDGLGDVSVGQGVVQEVIVVCCEEHTTLHAFGDPLLVEHQAGIVRQPQVEEARHTGHVEVEAVLLPRGPKALAQLPAFFIQQFGQVQPFHLLNTGDAGGKGYGGQPVAAGIADAGYGGLQKLLAAEGGDVVAVGQSLAEADQIRLEAKEVVAALKVQPEPGPHVVDDQQTSVFVAELADFLPEALGGQLVVHKIAVHIRLADDGGDFTPVAVKELSQGVGVVPVHIEVVHHVLFQNAGVVPFLGPGVHTVVIALKKDDFLPAGVGPGGHNGQSGHVAAVFCEKGPVRAGHGVYQQLGKLDHPGGGHRYTVLQLPLCRGGGIHIRVAVA